MLMNYHIGRLVLTSLCVGDLVRLRLSSVRVAGFRTLLKPNPIELGEPSRTPLYVGLPSAWGSVDGDLMFFPICRRVFRGLRQTYINE